ncbi:hypothetical protein CIB84_001605, partial [Bambusicola thoracicus]
QKDAINTTIINFNNENMQITWATSKLFSGKNVSFYYTFEDDKQKSWKTCPTYLLTQGYNSGCLFKTEGYTLAFSIMNTNGSEELFSKRLKSDFYSKYRLLHVFFLFFLVKPNRPENVTFLWKDDTVTVTCNKPERGVKCLRLELQYKSKYDKGWQNTFLHFSFLCRLQKSVMPTIPDPKYIFTDLFNDHNGNFQEWIDKTDHAVVQTKLEYEEPECIIEEENQQIDKKKSDNQEPRENIFSFSQSTGNNSPKAAHNACLVPTFNNTVSFAGLQNVVNDDMYVML